MHPYFNNLFRIGTPAVEGATYDFPVTWNRRHPLYSVHFEGYPITPGACQIQVALQLLDRIHGRPLRLHQIKNIKFAAPLRPQLTPQVTYRVQWDPSTLTARLTLQHKDTVYTKMTLCAKEEIPA